MNKQRHPKTNPAVRCCWICGKVGGDGFTSALRWLGYDVPLQGCVAHAHPRCMAREKRKAIAMRSKAIGSAGGGKPRSGQ